MKIDKMIKKAERKLRKLKDELIRYYAFTPKTEEEVNDMALFVKHHSEVWALQVDIDCLEDELAVLRQWGK